MYFKTSLDHNSKDIAYEGQFLPLYGEKEKKAWEV